MKKRELRRLTAFTLAETLITMAVIGVVAAVTVPALVINIQERVQNEQARSAKYKLTKATDKMKSLGLLDTRYNTANSTQDFVRELQKHLKLMKVCDNDHLTDCWPTGTINLPSGASGYETNVASLKDGDKLKSIALSSYSANTMGIVTADGTPMILLYSSNCTPLDVARTYSWSTIDNKPETNATTNCISAIIDTNGKKGPNMLGKDVRTLNSMYGSVEFAAGYAGISKNECNGLKKKLGINECSSNDDRWAAAVKKCHDLGLHLSSEQTLANAAGARYGRSDISPLTVIVSEPWIMNQTYSGTTCAEKIKNTWGGSAIPICITAAEGATMSSMGLNQTGENAPGYSIADGHYWSNVELSSYSAKRRNIYSVNSYFNTTSRSDTNLKALCVGD